MKNVYPAVFERFNNGGYGVRFPDLPGCVTTGSNLADALSMAEDAANLWICGQEDIESPIPSPSDPSSIVLDPNCFCTLIQVDSDLYRRLTDTRSVRKNVSLPAWMATMAERRGVNCSQVLQDALERILKQ
ncbi:MAG: type II toxin-antitoxin system HicB family antitoxin [Aristaeellaceae bacterium]